MPTPVELSQQFIRVLRTWMPTASFEEMQALNKAETHPGICHSHDFCDANMAMLEAYSDLTGIKEDNVALNEETFNLFNAAWDHATTHGLGR
jgi:hypothetical protein